MASDRQTDQAVLGALSVESMSGYALRQAISDVLGHFWSESFGQIYPTLAELRAAGLVEVTQADADSKPKFAITGRGPEHLRARLSEPPQSARPRNGTLLRLFFGRHLGLDRCRSNSGRAGPSGPRPDGGCRVVDETVQRQRRFGTEIRCEIRIEIEVSTVVGGDAS